MQQQITIPQALQYAVQLIQASRLDEARRIVLQVLQQEPNNHEAIHLMAYTANSMGNWTESEDYLRRAVALNPHSAVYIQNLGALLNARGQVDEAVACFQKSMTLDPRYPDPVMKMGLVYESRKDFDTAAEYYRKAIAIQPDFAEAHCNLGDILVQKSQFAEALTAYGNALRINPNLAEAYANRATAFDKLGREDEALAELQRAVQINPNMPLALVSLGQLMSRKGKIEQAIPHIRRATELAPGNVNFRSALAIAHLRLGQYEQAVEHCRRANQIDSNFIDPWVNLGLALTDLGEHDQALKAYDRALQIDPTCSSTQANRALIHLRRGDFEKGFADYDHRWQLGEFQQMMQKYTCPRWSGEPLAGKTLILWHEQGFGDTIHLIRYAKIMADQGATIIAQAQPQLLGLLKSVAGISRLITRSDSLPSADFHAPMLSIPGILNTRPDRIPAEVPYITPDPALVEQWRERMAPHAGYRVGIAWCGNPHLRLDHERSIPLKQFLPLSRIGGVKLFSLQVGMGTDQLRTVPMNLIDLTSYIRDFSDTAACIANLNLLITVDTAVLHLAGAMAKPVWGLIQKWPDWRWQLDREDSPWYPTIRLFRQPRLKDWASVMDRIASELPAEIELHRS